MLRKAISNEGEERTLNRNRNQTYFSKEMEATVRGAVFSGRYIGKVQRTRKRMLWPSKAKYIARASRRFEI